MQTAASADDEFARQRVVDSYRIVDSLPDGVYDDLVGVAMALCGTPIALLTLIDRERQWFKAQRGLDMRQTPRGIAICDHAIREPGRIMEVRDLRLDPRFAGNPWVSGGIGVRFYAGAPLLTPEGVALGTVCVLDHQPRTLTPQQRDALQALSRVAMGLIDSRRRELAVERSGLLGAAHAPSAAMAATGGYTVAILELQDFATAVETMGDLVLERALQRLHQSLEDCVHAELGDSVNRVTGSPEFIAVLHGAAADDSVRRLRQAALRPGVGVDLRILVGTAKSAQQDEPPERVYLRADQELSQLKSQASSAAGNAPQAD